MQANGGEAQRTFILRILPYADRALIMEQGTLVCEGVGDEIQSANLRETYLGS